MFSQRQRQKLWQIAGQKIFGVMSVETVERIELEAHFEEEASALRAKYLAELNGEAKKTMNRAAAPMTALIGLSLYGLVQSVAVAAKGN